MGVAISITPDIEVFDDQLEWQAIRAQGAGGQHVNKTSSAISLQFDINASSLPGAVKQRLLSVGDRRISNDGVITIKAQNARSQQANRRDAIGRLTALIEAAAVKPKPRIKTRPRAGSIRRRLDAKKKRGDKKRLRDSRTIRTDD